MFIGVTRPWWRSILFPGPYCFSIEAWSRKKEPLSATIVVIGSDKALVNQRNDGTRFNLWTPNTRGIIFIYRCEIYLYYAYILLTWKSICSGGCCFYTIIIFFNPDLNRGCLFYIFSLRFSGSKFLINLRRQFRVRKTFSIQFFRDLQTFQFVFKITISVKRNLCSKLLFH